MIRLRIPIRDDPFLYQLILRRLLPLSQKNRPELSMSKRSAILRLSNSKVFVAVKRDQTPFGFISMKIKQRILFIDMLAVESAGENKGWGSALMLTAENYGKSKGCKVCRLWVDDNNEHASLFYAHKGYEVIQYVQQIRCFMLEKKIV